MSREILQPPGWARPRGYANGVAATGRLVFVAGQIGWDAEQRFASDGFAAQVRQALANVVAVLACAGAKPEHLVRMTWYVTSRDEYNSALTEVGAASLTRCKPIDGVCECTHDLQEGRLLADIEPERA